MNCWMSWIFFINAPLGWKNSKYYTSEPKSRVNIFFLSTILKISTCIFKQIVGCNTIFFVLFWLANEVRLESERFRRTAEIWRGGDELNIDIFFVSPPFPFIWAVYFCRHNHGLNSSRFYCVCTWAPFKRSGNFGFLYFLSWNDLINTNCSRK